MKSKPLNSLLIPAVLILWIFVIYRYIGPDFFAQKEKTAESSHSIIFDAQEAESYKLLLNYEDPFLQGARKKRNSNFSASYARAGQKIGNISRIRTQRKRPDLQYQGSIAKGQGSKQTAIVHLGEENLFLVVGDSILRGRVERITPFALKIRTVDTMWVYKRQGF
ncbi:MAG: hypothetical protein MRZ79_07975 [Bacteroidia bacterium]|nr:hypothetical protein [Bacteroidia bacterium]